MNTGDIKSTPYAEWLECSIQTLFEQKPVNIALCATICDGSVLTAYFNSDAQDKAIFAHHINSDAMLDVVLSNADKVKAAIDRIEESPEK